MRNYNIKNIKIVTIFILGIMFFTYAKTFAINNPTWNLPGEVITIKRLFDILNFSYSRLPDPATCPDGSIVKWNNNTNKFDCISCLNGQYLVRNGNQWSCSNTLNYDSSFGCKLRYKIKDGSGTESAWAETDWGSANAGNWVYGPAATLPTNGGRGKYFTMEFRVGLMCKDNQNYEISYRLRGNHGPYGIRPNLGPSVQSGTNTFNDGAFTNVGWRDCDIKGGNGVCGFYVYDLSQSGPAKCEAQLNVIDTTRWIISNPSENSSTVNTYGSSVFRSYGTDYGIKMAIRCIDVSDCANPNTPLAGGDSSFTVADCSAAGGTVTSIPNMCICKFNANSCPSGWTQYNNWSETSTNTCSDSSGSCSPSQCSTTSHAWSDTAIESCTYQTLNSGKVNTCVDTQCDANITNIGCK